jgi:hypothetical protein
MFSPLAGLADARLGSPAIIVVGEVVRLARNWTHESIGRRRVA